MSEPATLSYFKRPHKQRNAYSAPSSKWDTHAYAKPPVPPEESGVLPIVVEREPIAACAGYFPGLPPTPKPEGAGAKVPAHDVDYRQVPRTQGDGKHSFGHRSYASRMSGNWIYT